MPFSHKTLDFLFQNKINDSKEWFEDHRSDYEEHVAKPMCDLVSELTPFMKEVDSRFICDPRVGRSVSRIYRDTRFSHDKSRYRSNVWLTFSRDKKAYFGPPGIFFQVGVDGLVWGCGWYQIGREQLDCARQLILRHDPAFKRAVKAFEGQSTFSLSGDTLKRTRFPSGTDEDRMWGDRKNLCLIARTDDFSMIFSGDAGEILKRDFKKIIPVYDFMIKCSSSRQTT